MIKIYIIVNIKSLSEKESFSEIGWSIDLCYIYFKGEDNMGIKQNRALILEGNMKRVIFTLSLPATANNFIQSFYKITDT